MIAIALGCRPQVLIADEPTTALDVTIQVQIFGLLRELCIRLEMAILFITSWSWAGRGLDDPLHPYIRSLIAAIPMPDPSKRILGTIETSEPPSRFKRPSGCAYAGRSLVANDRCLVDVPVLRSASADDRALASHNA